MRQFSKKAQAFNRFSKKHPSYKGSKLQDNFYEQASFALGICNISTWVRIDENDPRWDEFLREDGCEEK